MTSPPVLGGAGALPHRRGDPTASRAALYAECRELRADVAAASRFLVAGAGALGSEALKCLALMGAGLLVVVDPDRVEERNLARSVLYGPDDVGVPKVSAATARLAAWSPEGRVLPVVGDVRYDVGLGVLRRVDAVIGCLDGRASRLGLGRRCASADVPWVDGAIGERIARIAAFWPRRGGCYECTLTPAQWEEISAEGPPGCGAAQRGAREAGRVPTTPLAASVAGALLVSEALKIAHARRPGSGLPAPEPDWGLERYLVMAAGRWVDTRYSPEPHCGSHGGPWEVHEEPGLGVADPLAAAADRASALLGAEVAAWDVGHELVVSARCRRCDAADRPLVAEGAPAMRRSCPRCASPREVRTARYVAVGSRLARRPMWDLGIPPLDVLRFRAADGRAVAVELTGDLSRFPALLAEPLPPLPEIRPGSGRGRTAP
ncbi:ThiF family adenylyltransferase [Myxococcota bacterium]|nr:ThiF family adenylyltransferase [Myxococcota bacterium]